MRNKLLLPLLLILGFAASVQAWISINATPTQAVIKVDSLNIRDEPSTDG